MNTLIQFLLDIMSISVWTTVAGVTLTICIGIYTACLVRWFFKFPDPFSFVFRNEFVVGLVLCVSVFSAFGFSFLKYGTVLSDQQAGLVLYLAGFVPPLLFLIVYGTYLGLKALRDRLPERR